jgi:acylphosphatase
MMKARAHVIISGVVQGVSFRYQTRTKALENNVTGWVRNLPDGRVEVVFEGNKEEVEKMIEFCKSGPPNAYIGNVNVIWEDFKDESKKFEIRY